MLSREEILRRDDRRRKTVAVPAWEGDVLIRELSVADKGACFAAMGGRKDDDKTQAERMTDYGVEVVTRGCILPDGAPMFTAADADFIRRQPDAVVSLLVKEIEVLSNATVEDAEQAEKN